MTTTELMTLKTEPFVLNFGPVHPSTHGVYRMRATLDGEVVLDIEPSDGLLTLYRYRFGNSPIKRSGQHLPDSPTCFPGINSSAPCVPT